MQAMLDCGGEVRLTMEQFLTAAKQCMEAEADAHQRGPPSDVVRVLERLSDYVAANKVGWQASGGGRMNTLYRVRHCSNA